MRARFLDVPGANPTIRGGIKLVFYSKIAPWLENLQQQAIFDGAFSQTSECSAKF
jgi:hypothetical protein